MLHLLRYRDKVFEWCDGAGRAPSAKDKKLIASIDSWMLESTGYSWDRVDDAMDTIRFGADGSTAPCSVSAMDCHCSECADADDVPGLQSVPVVTGRMLELRDTVRWNIDDTHSSPVDDLVAMIDDIDEYLASAHALDSSQRHMMSTLLNDGSLTFEQVLRALHLVSGPV